MNSHLDHCDDLALQSLLFDDDGAGEFQSTWAHVEHCETCRARLEELSGSESFDTTVRQMLLGYEEWNRAEPATEVSGVNLDFLSEPTHPEMLGRLGRYEIERVVGSGGMGVILKGFDTELNRPVAIKVLARHLAHVGAARQRFAREARAAAAIVHEHIVPIHNVETEGETPFLVMQYIAGESLQSRVERGGALGVKEVLRVGLQVAAGLQAAHDQGVVHRDVKPSNILLEGGVERTFVTDFGLAQTVDDASLTHTGIVAGTPNYMSPEQAMGKPVDARSDLFSLGSVLYFMATGRPPFRAEKAMGVLNRICHETQTPVWQLQPEVPDVLSDLVDRLLEKSPTQRIPTAAYVQKELQRILVRLQQHRRSRWASVKRWFRRHKRMPRNAASALAACVLLLGATLLLDRGEESEPEKKTTEIQQFSELVRYQGSPEEALEWVRLVEELKESLRRAERESVELSGVAEWHRQLGEVHKSIEQFQTGQTPQ